nr:membrane progestin receptor delta isoform X5 [Oryctolagus cuniculus]
MGLGHPVLLPGGWTRLGLFPGSPLSPHSRLGLARLPGHSALCPTAWLAGAWDSARGAPGACRPLALEHPSRCGSTWRCWATMLSLKLPQLLRVHQVPRVFWEDGIVSGYRRPTSSALDCVLSSFQMTNETVNIWTHFLPTWYFLWRLLALAGGPGFRAEPYHWPLLVFLLPACLYPFASCCAHTFSSMSARARHICYFLDYGALSLYSLAACTSSLCPPRRSTPSCVPASPATPGSRSWKALGSVRSSARPPSPTPSCLTTSRSSTGPLPTSPAFLWPARAVLGPGTQLWAGGAEPQPRLSPPVRTAHWLSLRLPPAGEAGAWTL